MQAEATSFGPELCGKRLGLYDALVGAEGQADGEVRPRATVTYLRTTGRSVLIFIPLLQ
jgi:hypothetical protein